MSEATMLTGLGWGLALGLAIALSVSLLTLRALWKRTQAPPNNLPPAGHEYAGADVADFSAFGGRK